MQVDIISSTIHLVHNGWIPQSRRREAKYLDENKMMHESHQLWGMGGWWGVLLAGGRRIDMKTNDDRKTCLDLNIDY